MSKQSTISRFFKPVKKEDNEGSFPNETSGHKLGTSQENSICLDDSSDDELLNEGKFNERNENIYQVPKDTRDEISSFEKTNFSSDDNLEGMWKYQTENNVPNSDISLNIDQKRNDFDKKLNNIMKKRSFGLIGSRIDDNDEEILEDSSESPEVPTKKGKKNGSTKLTPLDQQVKDLKLKNMDKLLVVRVGYKYKCFAQDAVIASKILHIRLIPGKLTIDESNPQDVKFKQFAYCSFPDIRLNVHLQRLLFHNLIVSVVEQSETTAIKKNSNNKSNVFIREIANTFSKATYGVNNSFNSSYNKGEILGNSKSIWLLSVQEVNNILLKYILFSVNLNSGEIMFDEFTENRYSTESLHTRIKYLQPTECMINSKIASLSMVIKLLKNVDCTIHRNATDSRLENEKLEDDEITAIKGTIEKVISNLKVSKESMSHIYILYSYLKGYSNEKSLLIPSNYKLFLSGLYMILDHNALESLDLFSNEGKKGSLFWILDHTRTPFGSRELYHWISRPLIKKEEIEKRLDAVDCMLKVISDIFFDSLNQILTKTPDLLNTLNRISYGSTSRKEIYFFLKQLVTIGKHFQLHEKYIKENILSESSTVFKNAPLLAHILSSIDQYFSENTLPKLLSMINIDAALDKDKTKQITGFFNLNNYDNSEEILKIQRDIEEIKMELKETLHGIRKLLKRPQLEYKNDTEYLIEIRNTQVKNLPDDWIKVNNTKVVSRFTTPITSKLVDKLNYQKELLLNECNKQYARFLGMINDEYVNINMVIHELATYDCILSLAATSCNVNYSRPKFISHGTEIKQLVKIRNGRNPVIESLDITYVPNDVDMAHNGSRVNIITGPNMGGKSSYIRQVALLVIMAQIGSYVPATYMELSLFDNVLTRIGAQDNIIEGKSTFKMEMEDVLRCISRCTPKSLLLLDEVGRGTGTIDGKAISYALLRYFCELAEVCPLVLFTTHFPDLGASINSNLLKSYYMDFVEEHRPGESWPSVVFLYTLKPGTSNDSYGLNVAKLANVENEIITKAFEKSSELKSYGKEFLKSLELPMQIRNAIENKKNKENTNPITFKDRFKMLMNMDISEH
ncbi:similar to Saccharomyces cerevisiae YCR092C MSH3 Mismatch repair protein [Maudiozyma saulgeensis]|uniref:DNA mismatch repair protein MSH3 n=1 Tax=Maudiozyma saulgeensis TaxID=1789683 RepID=A0A1X7QY94_9SACH|nr:similar to Saccharomyces cerevisiae YCR092C MSH3 Mismatch repair protein [Kazachstania saulgeensis]